MGRPRLYDGQEAIDMRRQRAREASARYRLKINSQIEEKDESTTSSSSSEKSD